VFAAVLLTWLAISKTHAQLVFGFSGSEVALLVCMHLAEMVLLMLALGGCFPWAAERVAAAATGGLYIPAQHVC
jgi:hypothetical protein